MTDARTDFDLAMAQVRRFIAHVSTTPIESWKDNYPAEMRATAKFLRDMAAQPDDPETIRNMDNDSLADIVKQRPEA